MVLRPEYIDMYLQYEFDLILSGHAHGGQWGIPRIFNPPELVIVDILPAS
jgi:predicted MPP superfamily phosphohydrolase